jgi:hypothetical protein
VRIGRSQTGAITADGAVRDARVAAARRIWEEIPAERLVGRGLGLLVDAQSDHVYVPCRGAIFETGSARLIDERAGLAFYVNRDGWPVALERQRGTWSEIVRGKALRGAA